MKKETGPSLINSVKGSFCFYHQSLPMVLQAACDGDWCFFFFLFLLIVSIILKFIKKKKKKKISERFFKRVNSHKVSPKEKNK